MERALVEWFCHRATKSKRVFVGPGDDAAVFQSESDLSYVASTDMLMDQVDFLVESQALKDIGRKCLAVNLSDLAAMGAAPRYALVSLALPHGFTVEAAKEIMEGVQSLAQEHDTEIIGGDTNRWDQGLAVSITVIGVVPLGKQWTRAGAQADDLLLVTGELGGSILGRHLRVTPRLDEAQWLQQWGRVHAAIDISDGLSWDAWQVAKASSLGLIFYSSKIPVHNDARRLADETSWTAVQHALQDGEDFELLLTIARDDWEELQKLWPFETSLTAIGQFDETKGCWLQDKNGQREVLVPKGYEHA